MVIAELLYTVKEIMNKKFIKVKGNESIKTVLNKMIEANKDEVLVVDEEEVLIGVFTRNDIVQIKKNKELEQKRIFEKQKEIEIQKVKQQEFPENYKNFEKKFNNIINSINFYNKKEKIAELTKLQTDFCMHCIHPVNFKDTGTYCDGDTAGGMGYSYSSCNASKPIP